MARARALESSRPTAGAAGLAPVGRPGILDTAAALFLERGYEATSLRHLADAVGTKAGSLYCPFASKEQLPTAILLRGVEVMESAFAPADRETAGRPPLERVEAHDDVARALSRQFWRGVAA